jgi:hypothetical protein
MCRNSASDALLWLYRALVFTARAIRSNASHSDEELVSSFQLAYDEILRRHHGIMVRPIFVMVMKAVPYRRDFYLKLNPNKVESDVIREMEVWLSSLERIVTIIASLLQTIGFQL